MKIAIISDTHDNLATLDKFLAYIAKNPVGAIIHCGDIAEGETLTRLAKNFPGEILVAFGNMDYRDSVCAAIKKSSRITLFDSFGQTEFNGIKIGFCHHKETGLAIFKKEKFDLYFTAIRTNPGWKTLTVVVSPIPALWPACFTKPLSPFWISKPGNWN